MCETPSESSEQLSEDELRIRNLNDTLRQTFLGGKVITTEGFNGLPDAIRQKAMKAIQQYDGFTEANDPYGIHEFGTVRVEDQDIWFKIDAFDQNMEYGSPNPADPSVTRRVLTILLSDEY